MGKDRSTVANALRLLKLPTAVRDMVDRGTAVDGPRPRAAGPGVGRRRSRRLARQTVARELSVRQVETLVRRERTAGAAADAEPAQRGRAVGQRARSGMRLERALGTRVAVVEAAPGSGHIEIHYHSLDELDGLLERLMPQR